MTPDRATSARAVWAITPIIVLSVLFHSVHPAETGRPEAPQNAPPATSSSPVLDSLLAKAAEYCDRLDRSVLNFVCRERIEEWFRSGISRMGLAFVGPREKHSYLYDYQLLRNREGYYEERRTLLRDDGKKVMVPESPLKTKSFSHALVVEGPAGLLRRDIQAVHDYRILGEEKIGGEEAWVIDAVPKTGAFKDDLFGKIWLRKTDAGVLKIEWTPASIGNYEIIEEQASRLEMTPACVFTWEYAFEKNGIRFPSRYVAKEIYRRQSRSVQLAQVDVVYDEYKFFTVETTVDIRGGRQRP